MLYIVGMGLGGERGVTVRGLDAVRRCARIYMEARTALLTFGVDGDPSSRLTKLENLYGNAVTIAGREIVEGESGDQILCEATGADIAFLVVGHPFGSDEPSCKATYTDLVVQAKELGIVVKVIDSASVLNAVGACGLELHRYGEASHHHTILHRDMQARPFLPDDCEQPLARPPHALLARYLCKGADIRVFDQGK